MIATSKQHGDFSMNMYRKKLEENPNDEGAISMIDYYTSAKKEKELQESDEDWKKNNLEYDLRNSRVLCDKVKHSDTYAQNLYAALCNNDFQKLEIFPILKEEKWSCSWRYAGGIIADMREEGDYIDWYCSGIVDPNESNNKIVSEGVVTEEVVSDLKSIGWKLIEE